MIESEHKHGCEKKEHIQTIETCSIWQDQREY